MPADTVDARPRALGIGLLVGGLGGLLAAAALIIEKIESLAHPAARLSCDLSAFVGCSASLGSEQGSLLGIPNPLPGLVFWSVIVTLGVMIVVVEVPRWIWLGLALGMTGAFALVVWFILQSIYVIGVLCPWCMLTWLVTIPLFLLVVGHVLRSGLLPVPAGVRRAAAASYQWVWIITLGIVAVVVILAQLRLDVLGSL
ncbi:vitamin K epoxide reductase family protein [Parafrigoribacterium soli]|uniref:vitamin K epoxide reductase family protein n=1 Tax=Parafrigoribacterium soli TaxID=3144663 RepID=UPI0032ECF86C